MIFTPAEPQLLIDTHLQQTEVALLFVGMGIGKSAACLYRLHDLLRSCESIGALVVAPMRVANLTWPNEVVDWDQFSWMRVANLRTEAGQRAFLNGRAHIYTVNYESLHILASLIERRGKRDLPYDIEIWDELTKAKNPSSKRINKFRKLGRRAPRRWGLTGTPAPNSELDLFAQVRLIDDGARLGRNFLEFKRTYFHGSEYSYAPWKPKDGTSATIEKAISDITLTLRSSEWLDIPDTVVEDIEIPFCDELKERYARLERDLVIELRHDKVINVANAAALVTKLLQFTSGHMYDDEKDAHPIHNLKVDALGRLLRAEKTPLLVATIFQHEQQRIRAAFPQARFFADAKNERTQQELLREWNAGKVPMLVAHPSSVGHGLNLQHGSSRMVWTTLTYSRESYEQMIARLARRGQRDITRVYRLMVPGTVDDAVATALEAKAANEARLLRALQTLEAYRK